MYSGPGPGPLLAAAEAWDSLAAELGFAANGYGATLAELTSNSWVGPTSAAMTSAVTPYVDWMSTTAAQAEETANHARAAVAAYEAAFAMTVPPPVIAANRALLVALLATNFLGQNAPSIAATEAEYFEMWAQDAAAMYAYANSSMAASELTDFEEPPRGADSAGLARQAAAVAAAEADDPVQDLLSQNPLNQFVASFKGSEIDKFLAENTVLDDLVMLYSKYMVPYVSTAQSSIQSVQSFGQVSNGITAMTTFAKGLAPAVKAVEGAAQAAGAAATSAGANAGGGAAGLGRALPLGALSVPPSWAPASAVTNPGVAAVNTVVPAWAEGVNALPLASPFGKLGKNRYGRAIPTYGFKPSVMAKPPAAG